MILQYIILHNKIIINHIHYVFRNHKIIINHLYND